MKQESKIPREFQLGSHTINVIMVEKIEGENSGESHEFENKMLIANTSNEYKIDTIVKRAIFYHELVHMILDKLGYEELSKDEPFVQSFGLMLQQFEETKKF